MNWGNLLSKVTDCGLHSWHGQDFLCVTVYPVSTRASFLVCNAVSMKLAIHVHLLPMLRILGALPTFRMLSWYGP